MRAGALGLGLASVLHGPPPRIPTPGPVRDKAPEGLPARGQFRASGWYTGLNLASDGGKNVFFCYYFNDSLFKSQEIFT